MKPVDLLPAAQLEYDQSFGWYARQSTIAADRFERAVDEALRSIAADPERYVAVTLRHRACRVVQFPFRVIYRIEAERILVVAVAHAKRRPQY